MTVSAVTVEGQANLIQLDFGVVVVPFSSTSREFDPGKDLEIYIDGVLSSVQYFAVDQEFNTYLIFMNATFDPQSCVQIIYRIPFPAFKDANAVTVSGFAVVATYSTDEEIGGGFSGSV